jgi:cytochrome c-type biogenesis protein CcmH
MMIEFFVAAALVVVLALALLLWTSVGKRSLMSHSHKEMNAAIYRDQFAKLDQDRAENMLGEQDYLQARSELQRRIIDEASEEGASVRLAAPRKTVFGLVVLVPAAALGLYLMLGNPAAIGYVAPTQQSATPDVNGMLEALALKLKQDPDNPQGWEILARSYKVLGRTAEAEQAFAGAATYIDGNAQLLAIYADLVATNANGDYSGKPATLIAKALKLDANNPLALWLAGSAAFQTQDYAIAIKTWEQLLLQLPQGSEEAGALQASIKEASVRSGVRGPADAVVAPPVGAVSVGDGSTAGATVPSVSGVVTLDASLRSKVSADDVVMVIARAPGERMPRAVLRTRAADLPLKFTLDDTLSMSPQARISSATEVTVEARISKSGMAMPETGDLMSGIQTVKVGSKDIRLTVNQIRP